jgi:hypothetical protein
MLKKVIAAGLLGGVVLSAWTFVANAIFFLNLRVNMNTVAEERAVYEVLKRNITAPGGYMCNPALTPEGQFPLNEPVFSIRYAGVGHEAAGRGEWTNLALRFLTAMLAAWMLAVSSERILASYARRVGFFFVLGVWLAVLSEVSKSGIGGLPFTSALLLAGNTVVSWTLVGLAVAALIRPARTA